MSLNGLIVNVALVHHWLITMRGGEKVLEAIAELFPTADIFTLFYDPREISGQLNKHRITASVLNRIPLSHRIYPVLLPLYPLACRSLDLRGYDLVISSDSSLVKGVNIPPGVPHICYCHSPPRYLWEMEDVYLEQSFFVKRMAAKAVFPLLRRWDRYSAQKVDLFIANSEFVRDRIRRYYDRAAEVIYPPVTPMPIASNNERKDLYLFLGQLVPYKRADLAVKVFTKTGLPLVVIGEGPELARLKRMAGPSINFLGWQDNKTVRRYLASCRALIFPGEEDFGIVPIEAQMMGCPVIAFAGGGALETVIDRETGLFFQNQDEPSLVNALKEFEHIEHMFSPDRIRQHSFKFDSSHFKEKFHRAVESTLENKQKNK
jgi:glycosyltransferase involved in cell wall biosynthesis